jgi:putative tryptophan/tyrosine transport system substrate-binding protein
MNIHRRVFVVVGVGGLAMPAASFAQRHRAKLLRIGLLSPFSPLATASWHQAFRLGLRDLGWIEGQNVTIVYRYADGRNDRLPELAADLVHQKVDVIVAALVIDAIAAKEATSTIPIVVASAGDPVALKVVESEARPGGNVTGLSQTSIELVGKRLELLSEVVPNLSRVAVLWDPQNPVSVLNWKEMQFPARQLGVELHSLEVSTINDLDKAFEDANKARAGALAVMPAPLFAGNFKRIADLAAKARLPSIFQFSEFADAGGLLAYGPDRSDMFRRAATYVDKILKGAKPGDLPMERPTKFELVLNMNTAKTLRITVPRAIVLRVTRVIE